MELNTQEEWKAHLMASSEEFRELANRHGEYDRRLEQLEAMTRLSDDEQMEEVRLKKWKLHLKDQMNDLLHRQSGALVS
ncbi:MAG TPA: YdcH family protein [Bryobacteraceae bacterium]|nr:YdcH family protein [Bryobacteraceae bacterium]